MKFLLAEILIYLSAAGLFGLLIGWLMKAGLARRKLASVNSDWDKRYLTLKREAAKEVGELKNHGLLLQTDNTALLSNVESLNAMVKTGEGQLQHSNDEIKSLTATLASQQLTIKEITAESDKLVKDQSEMQQKLETLEKAKEQELAALAKQAGEASKTDQSSEDNNSDYSGSVSILDVPTVRDSGGIDNKIKALNEQRDRLNREREALFQREQLLASQLTRGDDTEAYLDQTIRIDDDMTASIQADLASIGDDEVLDDTGEIDPGDQTSIVDSYEVDVDTVSESDEATARPKSLWDKLKLNSDRTDEKTS